MYRVSPSVRDALREQQPVVALESTIITHGLPYPSNVSTAQEVEECVREHGAVPATIAILNGVIHVGLSDEQLVHLGRLPRSSVRKASRRDLALVLAQQSNASTTVASTMLIAHAVGIPIFATGGIGGVHRGGQESMDVSADLIELSRTPVAVVSAGVKSILDIPRTLEYLETHGVPVITLNSVDGSFPAFFSASSGVRSPLTAASAQECAAAMHAAMCMGMQNGMLIAVPNPRPMEGDAIELAVQQALRECAATATQGRDVTPFVLERVHALTGGASITANVELIKNNARVAARMAVHLTQLTRGGGGASTAPNRGGHVRSMSTSSRPSMRTGAPVVLGGACVDIISKPNAGLQLIKSTSNPGVVTHTFGGVGRNVCEALARVTSGTPPVLITALGQDAHSESLRRHCAAVRVQLLTPSISSDTPARTGVYNAMLDETGEMIAAVADMDVFQVLSHEALAQPLTHQSNGTRVSLQDVLAAAPLLICDGNVPESGLAHALRVADAAHTPVMYECTSVHKCVRVAPLLHSVAIVKANVHEIRTLARACRVRMGLQVELANEVETSAPVQREAESQRHVGGGEEEGEAGELDYSLCTAAATVLASMCRAGNAPPMPAHIHAHAEAYVRALREGSEQPELPDNAYTAPLQTPHATIGAARKYVVVTMGADGALLVSARADASPCGADMIALLPFFAATFHHATGMDYVHIPAPSAEVKKVTGAGDTFAGVLAAGLCEGMSMNRAARHALAGAYLAVTTPAGSGASTITDALNADAVARLVEAGVVPHVDEEEA